ncbi:MAG: NAD(P)H-hydrate epimerase [Mangrovicoccus sp.]
MKTCAAESPTELISSAEMRAIEAQAIGSGKVSGRDLMEQAGQGVVDFILSQPDFRANDYAVVLCGPGNNGGDGYVIARLLAKAGWNIAVWSWGVPENLPLDARANWRLWSEIGPVSDLQDIDLGRSESGLVIDALFGIGLSRKIEGALAEKLGEIQDMQQRCGASILAVDLPSGLETDTGEVLGTVLPAQATVTFHRPKPAHSLRPDLCGPVHVVDLGL